MIYLACWVLCGAIALVISHRLLDDTYTEASDFMFVRMSLCLGPLSLGIALWDLCTLPKNVDVKQLIVRTLFKEL